MMGGDQPQDPDTRRGRRRFSRPWERPAGVPEEEVREEPSTSVRVVGGELSPVEEPPVDEAPGVNEEPFAVDEEPPLDEDVSAGGEAPPEEAAAEGTAAGASPTVEDEPPEGGPDRQAAEVETTGEFDDLVSHHDQAGDLTHEDYMAATTREYQGLAEEVARANTEEFERQAVAAPMAGVGSGLLGFEDVTGKRGISEEEVEQIEQARASDLTLRVATGLVLLALFLGSLLLGSVWFSSFVTMVMLVSLGEFYETLRKRDFAPAALFGFLGVVGAAVGAHVGGPLAIGGFGAGAILLVILFYSMAARRRALENASLTVFGMVWVLLLAFAVVIGRSENSVRLILLLVVVTAVFDMGSYFIGRAFGRHLLAPRVSPKKTLEGLIGGIVTAVAVSLVLATIPLFDPLDFASAIGFAVLVSILAPLGDAAESVVKRALDVKDMGALLPGHGGMLDRIDAILFVAPGAYVFFNVLHFL